MSWVVGNETWEPALAGGFRPLLVDGRELVDPAIDLDQLLGAKFCPTCGGNVSYPYAFFYCPACGSPIQALRKHSPWTPPYGGSSGIKVSERALNLSGSKEPFPLPARPGRFVLLVAPVSAKGSCLFAIDKLDPGLLYVWSSQTRTWRSLPSDSSALRLDSHLGQQAWSCALAAGEVPGIGIPSDTGPRWLVPDLLAMRHTCTGIDGECFAGAVELTAHACFPMIDVNEQVCLALYDPLRPLQSWSRQVVDGVDAATIRQCRFAAPIVQGLRARAIWIADRGWLHLEFKPDAHVAEAIWHTWPAGWVGMVDFGPPWQGEDGLWQLLYNPEAKKYSYLKVAADTTEFRHCDGPRCGSGHSSFKMDKRLSTPFGDVLYEGNVLFFPLLEHHNGGTSQVIGFSVFWSDDAKAFFAITDEHNIRLQTNAETTGPPMMEIKLACPWEMQCFLFDGWFHVYHDAMQEGWKWKLSHPE